MLRGSRFERAQFIGIDGARHEGLVLRIAPARQAFYFAFVALLTLAAFLTAFSPIGAHVWLGAGAWVLGGLGVLGLAHLLAGGTLWLSQPLIAVYDAGLLFRAFGGATMVPRSAIRGVTLSRSGRRPQLRLELQPNARVDRHGTAILDGFILRGRQRLPVNMFATSPEDIASTLASEFGLSRDIRER